jgi:hypothetical protein
MPAKARNDYLWIAVIAIGLAIVVRLLWMMRAPMP